MKRFRRGAVVFLAFLPVACVEELAAPTPLVNTQLAQLQTHIEELEHELAVCYAGHELERGEEDKYLPKP
jgi:hypothetical protein